MDYFYGILDLGFWGYVLATVVWCHITIMAVTLYLHRDQAHRGLDLHPVLSHFFRFWIWINTGIATKEWVAVHRKHHACCETADDPHSPQITSLRTVLLQGSELYRAEVAKPETLEKYGRGTPEDWVERYLYRPRSYVGIATLVILDLVLFGVPGIIMVSLQLSTIPVLAAGVVNGLGHHTGYRSFETPDASTNIVPWAVVCGGEELHNNHHAFPSSARFSVRRWEFDIGWAYIRVLSKLGLARVKKIAPTPMIGEEGKGVDLETLRAVIVNRMHVLRDYTRNVTLPVFRGELAKTIGDGRALLRKAKMSLIRQPRLLDDGSRARLRELLEDNQALRTVHEFRERLQKLWDGAQVSNERLLAQFKEWCAQAEASGIKVLQDFAGALSRYTLQPAIA